uniref:PPR_long domain-containing protein n=1 Tax=Rhodnius prolixus TaxID=13249 RepID=T1HC17_RHOPR
MPKMKNISFVSAVGPEPNVNPIERSIQRLDQFVRRAGRISRKELLDVFDEIRHSRQATSTQSLLIIRCCGNLVPEESPEVRTRLVNEIWETLEKIGVALDISHYNALLRVYLENEHNFSPTDFLSMLDKKGIEPNRVTFQRLILAYCQKGDIEGATRILEFMKEKQMPVNESVFTALVVGHSMAGDMESAAGILAVMLQANIEPSGDTYTALLCGHARRGDIESINAVINECKEKGVELLDKDLLEVAFILAVNNHSDHLEEVLGHVRKVFGYNQDAKNVVLRLIVRGEDEAATKIFKTMTSSNTLVNENRGTFLIKQMVRSNRPLEKIVSLCADLKESGENEYALHHAVECSLASGVNPELSLKLLSALAAQETVCQHYYWPVLVQYGKARDLLGIHATLRQLTKEVGQPVSGETLKEYVLPYMEPNDQTILNLRQGGVSVATAAAATVGSLLSNNKIKEATRIALRYRANYNLLAVKRALVSAFLQTKDVGSFVKMVQILREGDRDEEQYPAEDVLQEISLSLRGEDRMKVLEDVLENYLDNGIGLSNEIAETLQSSFGGEELTQEISTLLSKLTSPDLVPKELNRPLRNTYIDKNNEEALLLSIKSAESKGESVNSLKQELLTYYCKSREVEKAQELINNLKGEGFEFPVGLLVKIMDLYLYKEMLTEASDIYNEICSKEADVDLDENKIIKYAFLLARNNKIEDAVKLFKKHNPRTDLSERDFSYTSSCWKLLNCVAETGEAALLKELFNTMKEKKFFEPNNVLLGPLIKVHLIKNDLAAALDQFEECCTLYRATPWKNELATRFIQNEDATSLQRLTDLSTQIHGEINSLYDLVLSFVECGRIRQARKILETPGLRIKSQRINFACERYTNNGSVSHLENLVEATKDLSHIDRADIYYHLLLSYCKADEVDKAIGLWTQMQDEDVQLTDQFLAALGALLKKHNRPVPFAIPELQPQTETEKPSIPTSRLSVLRQMRKAVFGKEVDEVLELKNKLNDSDLTVADRGKLLNLLVNSGRLREATQMLITWLETKENVPFKSLSKLINTLAKLGDVDSMDTVGKYLDKEMKKTISYTNRRTHCLVEAGRAEEILSQLQDDIRNAKTPLDYDDLIDKFPRGGIFSLLNAHPEHLPRVEEIAAEYRQRGLLEPSNVLWIHYTLTSNEEKAGEYWNYLKPSERLMFKPIITRARSEHNDQMIANLLKQCQEAGVAPPALGLIHSTLMDILLIQGKENECEKALEEAVKVLGIENLTRRVLFKIKKTFELSGKEFKYTIPPPVSFFICENKLIVVVVRKPQSADTSSSDSDGEEDKK